MRAISPLFHNIFDISVTSRVSQHIHMRIKCGCLIYFFPQFCKSDRSMSRYGYLGVFQRVPWDFEISGVDCICICLEGAFSHSTAPIYWPAHDKTNNSRANNLRHQPGEMHITATVTFVRIYDKIIKIS